MEAMNISKKSPLIKNLWLVDNLRIRKVETIILAGAGILREINSILSSPSTFLLDFPSVNDSTVDSTPWRDNQEEKVLENWAGPPLSGGKIPVAIQSFFLELTG